MALLLIGSSGFTSLTPEVVSTHNKYLFMEKHAQRVSNFVSHCFARLHEIRSQIVLLRRGLRSGPFPSLIHTDGNRLTPRRCLPLGRHLIFRFSISTSVLRLWSRDGIIPIEPPVGNAVMHFRRPFSTHETEVVFALRA